MVHQLVMPDSLTSLQFDRDDALAEEIVAGAIAAVVVARGHLDRQVRHPEIFIDRDLRPHAGITRVRGGLVLPCVGAKLAGPRDGMEGPEPLAGPHVEAADVPFHVPHALRVGARGVRGAHDHDVSGDHRRGMETHLSRDEIDLLIEVALQVDDAVLTEGGDARAGSGVEGDEPVTGRDVQNPLLLAVAPVREAASGQLSGRGGAARAFILAVHPEQLARCSVERHHRASRSGGRVEHALHHQRRRLELKLGARTQTVGLEAPGQLQVAEVRRVDLVERSVPRVAQIASISRPFPVLRAGLAVSSDGHPDERDEERQGTGRQAPEGARHRSCSFALPGGRCGRDSTGTVRRTPYRAEILLIQLSRDRRDAEECRSTGRRRRRAWKETAKNKPVGGGSVCFSRSPSARGRPARRPSSRTALTSSNHPIPLRL